MLAQPLSDVMAAGSVLGKPVIAKVHHRATRQRRTRVGIRVGSHASKASLRPARRDYNSYFQGFVLRVPEVLGPDLRRENST
jgi:hypothetical protein